MCCAWQVNLDPRNLLAGRHGPGLCATTPHLFSARPSTVEVNILFLNPWVPLPVPQATTWELISFSGAKPSARYGHVAAWSEAANGLYIHGGQHTSGVGAQEVAWGGDWHP